MTHGRRGRPPIAGTPAERAALRREKVRLNVQAFRRRERNVDDSTHAPGPRENNSLIWVQERSKRLSRFTETTEHGQPANTHVISTTTTRNSKSSDAAEPISHHRARLCLLITPSHWKQYTFPLIATFRHRFLPASISLDNSSHSDYKLKSPCASWVNTACILAEYQETGALKDGILATLFALLGMEDGNKSVQMESFKLYLHTLNYIRQGLNDLIGGKSMEPTNTLSLVLSCHVAALFELVINGSLSQMVQHVRGIGMLIRQHSVGTDAASSLLEDYRMLEIAFCLTDRRVSTLATRAKRTRRPRAAIEHYAEPSPDDRPMSELLDVADEISFIMVYLDNLILDEATDSLYNDLTGQASKLMQILSRIEEWMNALEFCYGPIILEDNCSAHSRGHDTSLRFTTFELGSAWIYGLSFKLYAFETCIEVLNNIQTAFSSSDISEINASAKLAPGPDINLASSMLNMRIQLRYAAHMLSMSLFYFIEGDKGIIERSVVLFPLEACFNALENEKERLVNDKFQTGTARSSRVDLETYIHRKIDETVRDLELCQAMASRAKELCLPLFCER